MHLKPAVRQGGAAIVAGRGGNGRGGAARRAAGRARFAVRLPVLALAALLIPLAAVAQDPGGKGRPAGLGNGAAAPEAPVISAPDDPGRFAPGPMKLEASESAGLGGGGGLAGVNNFVGPDGGLPTAIAPLSAPALPVVVELFTSQGCSSCPPADAMLGDLSDRTDVLTLSFHVDYWDYLGWADSFARPEFSRRQEDYARAGGERALFTPQLIVDGRDTAVAPGPAQLMALIDASRLAPALLSVQRETTPDGESIRLMPLSDLGAPVEILLVRYAPRRQVDVTAGENRGRTVTYTNVVLALDKLADWDGRRPLRLTVRPEGQGGQDFPADTRHALLVQAETPGRDLPGPILAALRLD